PPLPAGQGSAGLHLGTGATPPQARRPHGRAPALALASRKPAPAVWLSPEGERVCRRAHFSLREPPSRLHRQPPDECVASVHDSHALVVTRNPASLVPASRNAAGDWLSAATCRTTGRRPSRSASASSRA